MKTQWLFFDNEEDGQAYNAVCNSFLATNPPAKAWNSGFNPETDQWSNVWPTTSNAELWPAGDANNVLGKWAVSFMGLPFWGFEMDYRTVQGGYTDGEGAHAPSAFPLDDGGAPPVQFDRAYWLSTIPIGAVFVESLEPVWSDE